MGVSINGGYPKVMMLHKRNSHEKMDDDFNGYSHDYGAPPPFFGGFLKNQETPQKNQDSSGP